MTRTFLSAEWKNLLMANYAIDPAVLKKYLPRYTELDFFNNTCYVSLVGFLFANVRLKGVGIPFHRNFEEVNLRFYVRYKQNHQWVRGVVFIKEIVPMPMISLVANLFYGEQYVTHRMQHQFQVQENHVQVNYRWKVGNTWNFLQATADREPVLMADDSEENFITEHYWGYTRMSDRLTGAYQVVHPKWRIHKVHSFNMHCSVEKLYGPAFKQALSAAPRSVFLAEGSPVQVLSGSKIVLSA